MISTLLIGSLLAAGGTVVTPGPAPQKRVEARPNGAVRVVADGGAFGIECLAASAADAGCLTTGVQDIKGQKNFVNGIWSVDDAYFSGRILGYPGHQVQVFADRAYSDTAPAVVVGNQVDRDGGGVIFSARAGLTKDMVIITEQGNVSLSCGNAATTGQCSFVDATGVSGHVTLRSINGGEVVIMGDIGNPDHVQGWGWDAGLPDGGNPDGGPANTDGGNLYYVRYIYGGRHADTTLVAGIPRYLPDGGPGSNSWVLQTKNPDTDEWFFVQRNGAFGQANQGVAFSTFGETAPNIATSIGQYYPWGDHATVLRFGRGSTDNDQRWAWKKENGGPADGGWGIIPDRSEVLRVTDQTSQTVQFGTDVFVGGTKLVTFTTAFGGAPSCSCITTSATVPCSRGAIGTSSVTFNGTGTNAFDWQCMGPK